MISLKDISVVVPTLFRPPTFAPLCQSVKSSGASLIVVEGMTTSAAYNEGIFKRASTRYVILATDDIVVMTHSKRPWPALFLRHFAEGDTWVGVPPVAGLNKLFHGHGPSQIVRNMLGHLRGCTPHHRGHLFAVDREVDEAPIPDDLVLAYGDDWFYWRHQVHGAPCIPLDIGYATGREVENLGQPEHASGWTHGHPDFDKFLGKPHEQQAEEDKVAAEQYFEMFKGETRGLKEPVNV